jgi:hypothetical protein
MWLLKKNSEGDLITEEGEGDWLKKQYVHQSRKSYIFNSLFNAFAPAEV